ncbi:hypothetical protein K488DRAFT_81460 [Vararia minispora EC-137]|uniref:Uncharacterized protein n=1 Tax=Vararia minispora EC-137 TaxID=1314806 RepID=A0ACB8R0B4_9AGAM|nr:hypothetical protein K488DRAFT_81460 [Vararia minispora EC-137]
MGKTTDTRDVLIHVCLELVGLTILYYDYILTFPREVECIWPRTQSWSFVLFLLNRYVPIFGDISIIVFNFSRFASAEKTCRSFVLGRQILLVFNQVIVAALLALRIIALYHKSKRIIAFVIGSSLILFPIACWSITRQHSEVLRVPNVHGCFTALTSSTGTRISIAWVMQAAFDIIIFILTILHTLATRRSSGGRGFPQNEGGVLELVYRDGAIYFITMAFANVANILTFVLLPDPLRGTLSTFASSISVTLMSHLILNLYAAAASNSLEPRFDATANVIFTSRIGVAFTVDEPHEDINVERWEPEPYDALSSTPTSSLTAAASSATASEFTQYQCQDTSSIERDRVEMFGRDPGVRT